MRGLGKETSRYFSFYERPGILVQNQFRRAKSIAELALGVVSRSLFIGEGVIYPPRDEVLMSLQVFTGDCETDRRMWALVKCTNNLAIQKFRSLANWIFHGGYDFESGVVRQTAAIVFLGSRVSKKVKRRGLCRGLWLRSRSSCSGCAGARSYY